MRQPLLELRHLQMIATLIETPRVTDAAEHLGITPSALSHRIREAERRMGVPLFIRVNKRLRMTPAAEYLAQVAERLLGDLARAEDDVRRMNRGVHHVVRIAVEAYSSYHWLPDFLKYLSQHEDHIGIQIAAAAARTPLESLMDRSVDLVICSGQFSRHHVDVEHLFDDDLKFIMAPDHPLAQKPFVAAEDVVGLDFITYTRVPEPDREYAKLFRPNEAYPNWTETVELPEAIVEMVAAGLGTSVLAGWAIQGSIASKRIHASDCGQDGITVPWYAAIRPGKADDDVINQHVVRHLADWSRATNGFGASHWTIARPN